MNPVPVPQPEPEKNGSSVSKTSDVSEAAMHTPRITKNDLETIANKIRYDLDSAKSKLVELNAYIASLNLPTNQQPFSEERFLTFVRNTAHVYTDRSLEDEIRSHGATDEFIKRALKLAAEVRASTAEATVEN